MTVQQPNAPHRHWLLPAGAIVALIAAGAVAACHLPGSDGTPDATGSCTTPTAPISVAPTAADHAPGGGGLSVVETGFFSPTASGDVSVGAIVANTSSQAAYRTRVEIHALRANGRPAVPARVDAFFHQEIPVILPGQRVAVGAVASLDTSGLKLPTVARVQVDLIRTRWVPAAPANPLLRPITADILKIDGSDGTAAVDFGVTAASCAGLVTRGAAVVFRDANGKLVGGHLDATRGGNAALRCRGDGGPQQALVNDYPRTADLSRTQVSLYCDAANAPLDPPGSNPPVI